MNEPRLDKTTHPLLRLLHFVAEYPIEDVTDPSVVEAALARVLTIDSRLLDLRDTLPEEGTPSSPHP